ncbi:hypothetical protein PS928_05164 [Pseudomonas fluorescens]|jgi:hypothetical protein|uniref:Uncharacterized protein n=2 Tax=Pseudomonas TaxID=286 RepID=A0A5E7VFF0_PSEFL|nr:hypothetical protein PS928_05164 [Pseudomonas fluorescens]
MPWKYRYGSGQSHSYPDRPTCPSKSSGMKKSLFIIALTLLTALFVGYYEVLEDAETRSVVFIKQSPTFQVKFRHLFANDADDKPLSQLSNQERQAVINYCKYRLGVTTDLKTQDELEVCKQR